MADNSSDPRVGDVEQSLGGVDTVVAQVRPLSDAEKQSSGEANGETNDNGTSGDTGSGTNEDSKVNTSESDTQGSNKQSTESNDSQGDDKSGEAEKVDKEGEPNESASIDLSKFMTPEFMETGKLTEDQTQKVCEAFNLTPEAVDYLAAGMHVRLQQREAAVFEPVGGKEQFETMKSWAEANFTDSQKEAFDKAVTGNDEGMIKKALVDLKNRYVEANGSPKEDRGRLMVPTLSGNSSSNEGTQPYKSYGEYRGALADPRYGTDPAFTQEVTERGILSQRAGIF